MRGTVVSQVFGRVLGGITPAHAGNRLGAFDVDVVPEDHPRACGEQWRQRSATKLGAGSPPRMRGTVGLIDAVHWLPGITPAHAGNSSTWHYNRGSS